MFSEFFRLHLPFLLASFSHILFTANWRRDAIAVVGVKMAVDINHSVTFSRCSLTPATMNHAADKSSIRRVNRGRWNNSDSVVQILSPLKRRWMKRLPLAQVLMKCCYNYLARLNNRSDWIGLQNSIIFLAPPIRFNCKEPRRWGNKLHRGGKEWINRLITSHSGERK